MNKRDFDDVLYSSNEDQKITKAAYTGKFSLYVILIICLFLIVVLASFMSIINYRKSRTEEVIVTKKIINKDNQVVITNNGIIDQNITANMMNSKGEYSIFAEDSIEFLRKKDANGQDTIKYNVRYSITDNTFESNAIPTNESELLVRFLYSYDNENWNYINNVISTDQKNLNPLMGSYFDIAGITSTLKVATDYEITVNPGESKKIYWRCETTVRSNFKKKFEGNIKANFYITVD